MTINGDGTWTIGSDWPWPQMVLGSFYTLGFGKDATNLKLYELYCNTSDVWQSSEIATLGLVSAIDHVDYADFQNFYVVSTFKNLGGVISVDGIIRNPGTGAPLTTALPTANIPAFGTCCNFNGQGVIGCIAHGDDGTFGDMGYNTVAWSGIGRFDFKIQDATREPKLLSTAGYVQMDWGEWGTGIVHKVAKIGNAVIVLGDGGIAKLTPVSEPVVTFAKENVHGFGIASANHTAGDDNIRLFLDNSCDLWLVDKGFKFKKLGYRSYMQDLTNADIRVSYNAAKTVFYISDGVTGYGLNEFGLFSTNQLVSSTGTYRGTSCGFYKDSEDYEWRVELDTDDFGQRGLKTLTWISFGLNYYSADNIAQATVRYRYDYKDQNFSTLNWIDLNPQGAITPVITATEFRFLIKGEEYRGAEMTLDYLKVRFKLPDRRGIRGMYNAGSINAKSSK